MSCDRNHNLLIWLLALMVVFAPMQAALSAIDMLTDGTGQTQHCQHDMTEQVNHGDMNHGDCCPQDGACADNCASCTQCISVHAVLFAGFSLPTPPDYQFEFPIHSLVKGITDLGEYRPPRFFS